MRGETTVKRSGKGRRCKVTSGGTDKVSATDKVGACTTMYTHAYGTFMVHDDSRRYKKHEVYSTALRQQRDNKFTEELGADGGELGC